MPDNEEVILDMEQQEENVLGLELPIEIPWQQIGSSEELKKGSYDFTNTQTSSVSIFSYVPKSAYIEENYPDEDLVYFKISVSLSPVVPRSTNGLDNRATLAARLMDSSYPIRVAVLDLNIRPRTFPISRVQTKPYFISAAPLRREIIESGVIGNDIFESGSSALSIGKSGTQMHESFASTVDTQTSKTSVGGGIAGIIPPIGFALGGSYSNTSTNTDISGVRETKEVIDTTQRDASQERRELTSHMTSVTNILSLLTTKHVGTPFLKFTMRPRPVRQMSIDPRDPNNWYSELMRKRSSGLEGIQEFYCAALIPKNRNGFCINAQLRKVWVIDPPIALPKFEINYYNFPSTIYENDLLSYLRNKYPVGTPIADVDVDLYGYSQGQGAELSESNPTENLSSPRYGAIVADWQIGVFPSYSSNITEVHAKVGFPLIDLGGMAWSEFRFYKLGAEVYRDMEIDRYYSELFKSPLERGSAVSDYIRLSACRQISDNGKLKMPVSILQKPKPVSPGLIKHGLPGLFPQSSHTNNNYLSKNPKAQIKGAIHRWNQVQEHFASSVSSSDPSEEESFRFDNPQLLGLMIKQMEQLDDNHPANESIRKLMPRLKLTKSHLNILNKLNVKNLRGLAQVITKAEQIEQHRVRSTIQPTPLETSSTISDADAKALKAALGKIDNKDSGHGLRELLAQYENTKKTATKTVMKQPKFPLSSKDAATIRSKIGKLMQSEIVSSSKTKAKTAPRKVATKRTTRQKTSKRK